MDTSSMRRAIIERLGGPICHDCRREFEYSQLKLHHLKEGRGYANPERYADLKRWLNGDLTDVLALCEDCHRKRHGVRNRAFPDDYQSIFSERES
jgi:5-methylcytosine-specific restriction endonuclease McrA